MVTVALVYRPGKVYTEEYVKRLLQQLGHLSTPFRAAVITTEPVLGITGAEVMTVPAIYPGWWNKMFLFEPGRFSGRVLYFDLDTLIHADLPGLTGYAGERPLFLDDFYYSGKLATGVMAWKAGQLDCIWEAFQKNPQGNMKQFDNGSRSDRGDQALIRGIVRDWLPIQDFQPGVYSYKRDIRGRKGLPCDLKLTAFHGSPRPHEIGWTL